MCVGHVYHMHIQSNFLLAFCLAWTIVTDRDLKETEGSKKCRSKCYENKQLIKERNSSHEFMEGKCAVHVLLENKEEEKL